MKTARVYVTTVNNSDTSADRDGCAYYDYYYGTTTTMLYKAHYRTILQYGTTLPPQCIDAYIRAYSLAHVGVWRCL